MAVPALIYLAINANTGDGALAGWAIPTATDIAFALAVLAVIGTHLPAALRTFLLTLAVVDDLLAITIIAIFYTSSLQLLPLALALIPLGVFMRTRGARAGEQLAGAELGAGDECDAAVHEHRAGGCVDQPEIPGACRADRRGVWWAALRSARPS